MSPIVVSNLSFSWPDDTVVFSGLSFTVPEGRTGLVAPNGAGKSTLLRLIAGEHRPRGGTITVDGAVGYLPQTLPFEGRLTVAEVLGVQAAIDALDALAGGDSSEAVFTAIGDDWDV
jgi:ABC-type multidrug transport system ATPase subunit